MMLGGAHRDAALNSQEITEMLANQGAPKPIWKFKLLSPKLFKDYPEDYHILLRRIMYRDNKNSQTAIHTTDCERVTQIAEIMLRINNEQESQKVANKLYYDAIYVELVYFIFIILN